jgi:hypothetical protein
LRGTRGSGIVTGMKLTPAKLFHAVVITGAALTGCAGTAQRPASPSEATKASSAPDKGGPQYAGTKCPPGSERPYPPCFWIR